MGFIEITGFDKAAEQVKKMSEMLQKEVISQVQEIGENGFATMEADTPVRTGFLKSRWNFEINQMGFVITNDCPYVGFVEFGTSRMPPRNFITPAYEAMRSDIDALIQQYSTK